MMFRSNVGNDNDVVFEFT